MNKVNPHLSEEKIYLIPEETEDNTKTVDLWWILALLSSVAVGIVVAFVASLAILGIGTTLEEDEEIPNDSVAEIFNNKTLEPIISEGIPDDISLHQTPLPDNPVRSWRYAVKKSAPAVVNIKVIGNTEGIFSNRQFPFDNFFRNYGRRRKSRQGSGVFIAPNEVVTNLHVVANIGIDDSIKVELLDGRIANAQVVGKDKTTDIALLKLIDLEGESPVILLGDSEELQVGDPVAAIGNPFGVGQTVTQGIISATHRNIGNPFLGFLQTDAAINPGNSGGALVDIYGRLVGISSQIVSETGGFSGVGFAIPIDTVITVTNQLRVFGSVQVGWLGIAYVSEATIQQDSYNINGIVLRSLYPDSPLVKAGMQPGDLIVEIDGEIASRKNLISRMTTLFPNESVRILFVREGELLVATPTATERPKNSEPLQ